MKVSSRYRHHIAQADYDYVGVPVSCCSITKLAIGIVPPCPHGAIGLQSQAMIFAYGNSYNSRQICYCHLGTSVCSGIVTQLSTAIITPRPDRPIGQ